MFFLSVTKQLNFDIENLFIKNGFHNYPNWEVKTSTNDGFLSCCQS